MTTRLGSIKNMTGGKVRIAVFMEDGDKRVPSQPHVIPHGEAINFLGVRVGSDAREAVEHIELLPPGGESIPVEAAASTKPEPVAEVDVPDELKAEWEAMRAKREDLGRQMDAVNEEASDLLRRMLASKP